MNNRQALSRMPRLSNFIVYLFSLATLVIFLSLAIDRPVIGQTGELEVVAEFSPEHPPGNIAITPQGRLIMSQHQFYGAPLRVVEVESD